jgi:hypothetical protein
MLGLQRLTRQLFTTLLPMSRGLTARNDECGKIQVLTLAKDDEAKSQTTPRIVMFVYVLGVLYPLPYLLSVPHERRFLRSHSSSACSVCEEQFRTWNSSPTC